MDEIDFTYNCPNCGEGFCGSMPCDQSEYAKLVTCEDCGHKYSLSVYVELHITTN